MTTETRKGMGRKLYCVVIKETEATGATTVRPLKSATKAGAFPDGSTTRFQAKKLLRKALRNFPQAKLGNHRVVL